MRTSILFIFLIALSVTTIAQNITAFEYFFDTDPGFGLATVVNPPASPSISDFNIPISTASLSTGFHILYLRGKNTANQWTHTHLRSFYIVALSAPTPDITQIEYFIDTDPGVGLATQVSFTAAPIISNLAIDISAVPLTSGFHILYVRSKSSDGKWTHTHLRSFYIVALTASTNLSQIEYFIDTDPGIGLATQVPFAAAPSITNLAIDISAVPLTPGFHKLYVRTKSSDGQWTHTQLRSFYIANVGVAQNLVKFEYFFDTDPGFDSGTAVAITPAVPSVTNQDVFADASGLSIGSHNVYVRAKDSGGEWTHVSTGSFSVTAALPPTIISFAPTAGPVGTTVTITGTNFNTTPANNIVYFGATKATVTAATSTQLTVSVPIGATYQPITVTVAGLTGFSSKTFIVTFTGGGSIDACAFAPSVDFVSGVNPLGMATADFDGDGKVDVAITNRTSQTLAIYRNTSTTGTIGASSLGSPLSLATLADPFSATAVDIDGDGKLDIAVTNAQSATLSLYRNTSVSGTISFDNKVDFVAGNNPLRSAFGDLDGDGKPELAIANRFSNSIGVYKNTSSSGPFSGGTFATAVNFTTGSQPYDVAIGDLNGDDKPELMALNNQSNSISVYQNVSVLGTINSSSFATNIDFTAGSNPNGIELADMDGDDGLDIVLTNFAGNTISILRNLSLATISSGSFSPKIDFSTGSGPFLVAIADYNGDGKLDLAVSNSASNTISILRNTSTSGSITAASLATKVDLTSGSFPLGIITADIDGDGKTEIIAGNHNGNSISIFRNVIGSISTPTITSFTPSSGPIGTFVNITGTNFNTLFSLDVKFNGTTALILDNTGSSIKTEVPMGATTGPLQVTIGCNTITGSNFTVDSPAGITITTQPSDFIACIGQTATFTTSATGATNIIYRWQFSPDGIVPYTDIANGGGYSNATTATLSVNTTANFGLGRYRCRINGDFASEVITTNQGLSINLISTAPTAVGANRCGAGSVTLTASGGANGQYKWYTVPTGGTAIAGEINGSYVTPSISSTTSYYVSLNTNGCESTRTIVTATLTITPAPTATGVSGCPASLVTLTASGGTNGQYNWYTVASGGTSVPGEVNSIYQIPSLTASTTFFVSLTINGCESTRTPVTATLLSTGCAPVITTQTLTTQVEGKIEVNLQSLITTPGTLDPTSIKVITQPASGAVASITNFLLVIDYKGKPFSGKETIIIEACNTNGLCAQQTFTIEVAGEVIVFNAVSPNGDGKNEFLVLQYIESISPKNQVNIYNRWGDEVFSISDYDNKTRVFAGLSTGGSKLPVGTYFYKIVLADAREPITGFISLKY